MALAGLVQKMSLALNTGAKMPLFGLGTWQSPPGKVGIAIEAALKAGYRHLDCAQEYENEEEIGHALQKCFKEGVVKREDVFITSKLWSSDHELKNLLASFHSTLEHLQLNYLDLYLIHWPASVRKGAPYPYPEQDKLGYVPETISKCWQHLEELVSKGLVRAIGVSNFTITKTENLLKTAKIVPAVNQVECHPYLQQQKLKDYCDSKGIVLEAYSPLGNPGRPDKVCGEPEVMQDVTIRDIASKHCATPAQVCLSFARHRGVVAIPKTVQPFRIVENMDATKLTLDEDDLVKLRGLDRGIRLYKAEYFLKQGERWQDFWDVEADKDFVIKKED